MASAASSEERPSAMPRPLRIGFVIPRFITEHEGGLATYVDRVTRILLRMGHEPEVFCLSGNQPTRVDYYGVRVDRVAPVDARRIPWLQWMARRHRLLDLTEVVDEVGGAWRLARAVAERESEKPFDFVHCSDVGLPGLFVRKGRRPMLTRCSWARDLYHALDEKPWTPGGALVKILERLSVRRADVAYAPSRFIAEYLRRKHGIHVGVLRPPFSLERPPADRLPEGLPARYLMYFGFLRKLKGTDVLAEALPLVWREEPEFAMVWAGSEYPRSVMDGYRRLWGSFSNRVVWFGEISKPAVYRILMGAEAAVLPSLCDNLPNTAIESLAFGIPVIGTRNSSLEELVEPGACGHLVPAGDAPALAEAMLRVWRGDRGWTAPPAILREMDPQVAVAGLLKLAGFEPVPRTLAMSQNQKSSPIILERLHPPRAVAGQGFNVQPDGRSALSVACVNAGFWTTILFGDTPLKTTYGGPTWLSALVPQELLSRPGRHLVRLVDEHLGESNALELLVERE